MADSLKSGDRVEWPSSQGTVAGEVKRKLVKPTRIKGHRVAASPENPEYLVESEKTGAQAAHKPASLKKAGRKKRGPVVSDDAGAVIADFKDAVNITARQLEAWLETEESRRVGSRDDGDAESVGHHSGRRIVAILGKKKADYTDDDLRHMAKVVGYVHRHLAQRPEGDIEETPWRYSLMNWGHDPTRKPRARGSAKSTR